MPSRSAVHDSNAPASEVRLALEVPRWALRFYARHLALVIGISLIPSAQRAVGQLWGTQLPGVANTGLEVVTAAARVALFVAIFRLAILSEDRLADVDVDESLRRMARFGRRHWGSLLLQVVLLAVAFVVFDRIPDAVIAHRVPEHAQPIYWAVLLAVKNPTIIAVTMIWEIGVVRQMLLHDERPADSETAPVSP